MGHTTPLFILFSFCVLLAVHFAGFLNRCLQSPNSYTELDARVSELGRPHLQGEETVIISAVMGTIDRLQIQAGHGVLVFDELREPLPFPRRDVNQRLRAKYFKMSTHWLNSNFSAYIWVDGSFSIEPAGLRAFMARQLASADCAFFLHPTRRTILQELEYVKEQIAEGSKYLLVRYGNESMDKQVDAYVDDGFPVGDYPLLGGGLFIRRNTPRVNAAFDHWLIENLKWTIQDQLSLPYILWKHNLTYNIINGHLLSGPYHNHTKHTTALQRHILQ